LKSFFNGPKMWISHGDMSSCVQVVWAPPVTWYSEMVVQKLCHYAVRIVIMVFINQWHQPWFHMSVCTGLFCKKYEPWWLQIRHRTYLLLHLFHNFMRVFQASYLHTVMIDSSLLVIIMTCIITSGAGIKVRWWSKLRKFLFLFYRFHYCAKLTFSEYISKHIKNIYNNPVFYILNYICHSLC
jgi:hypothetical protein